MNHPPDRPRASARAGSQTRAAADGERLLQEALAAQRAAEAALQIRDDILSVVSHELRTPLSTIATWAHLLTGKEVDLALYRRGVEAIARSAEVEARLISDLLDLSRMMAGKLTLDGQPLSLEEVTQEVVAALAPAAGAKGVILETSFEARALVKGDRQRLRQAISNLFANALEFTPTGGTVRVHLARKAKTALLEISDTGVGIAPAVLPHVFERFRRADPSSTRTRQGIGLGLAIAKHLVELHGGTIEVASEGVGKGAAFTIRLPCDHQA